jgi:hypothetical protein
MHLITKLAAVVPAATLTLIGPALSASAGTHASGHLLRPAVPAVTGTTEYTQGSAGYAATGVNFKTVTETATLRDPSEYASVTDDLGFGVTLKSATAEVDLGLSDTTTSGTQYSPGVDLYLNNVLQTGAPEYNAQWCPASSPTCQPAADGAGFAAGDAVTETLTFNKANGVLDYTAYDAAGNVFTGQFGGLKGQNFSEADVGGGFDPGDFTPPPTSEKFVTFQSVGLVSYGGKHYTLSSAAITTSAQVATSDGTATGTVQAKPSALKNNGKSFSVAFEPAS